MSGFWQVLGGKKVKCLTKWVRLAPIELKLCRNDQAMIRTSKMLILANFSQFFEGKSRFFFFLSPLPPPELTIFPVFSHTKYHLPSLDLFSSGLSRISTQGVALCHKNSRRLKFCEIHINQNHRNFLIIYKY